MDASYNNNLHKNADGKLYEYGRELRKRSTEAEQLLWQHLRGRKFNGLKFRRQHPMDKYIADFYCHEIRLVIEVDGQIHDNLEVAEYDRGRALMLNELEIRVIRFRNEEIMNNITEVLKKIIQFI